MFTGMTSEIILKDSEINLIQKGLLLLAGVKNALNVKDPELKELIGRMDSEMRYLMKARHEDLVSSTKEGIDGEEKSL